MESIEKLRQAIGSPELTYEGERAGYSWYTQNILEHVDAVEREIAERYMELPVDADGVPCKIGDKLQAVDDDEYTVDGYLMLEGMLCAYDNGDGGWFRTRFYHHAKPRTLEDVLREFASGVHGQNADFAEAAAKRYADEIRELLEVDE